MQTNKIISFLCGLLLATNAWSAKVVYLIPPNDAAWHQGSALLLVDGNKSVRLEADTILCGYFKISYAIAADSNALFMSETNTSTTKIGANGVNALTPIPFNFKRILDSLAHDTLFYNAQDSLWYANDPQLHGQCSYPFATIFYDTDAELHGAFSCDEYPNVGTSACPSTKGLTFYDPSAGKIPCLGVIPGIVLPTLGVDRKPIYSPASGCMKDSTMFNTLFRSTTGVNELVCVDLNVKQTSRGAWEFNSDSAQGFYPVDDLTSAGTALKRTAYTSVAYGTGAGSLAKDNVNSSAQNIFPANVNWSSLDTSGQTFFDLYPSQKGEFTSGSNPDVYNDAEWGSRSSAPHNRFFCSESHGSFVYNPSQKWYFRSSDDLWVFINNKIAVDLGGMHLSAPGAVSLDTLGLVAGNSYPVDMFHCNRRNVMSDFRFSTNMYVPTSSSLYYEQTGNTYVFEKTVNASASCGALIVGGTRYTIDGSTLKDLVFRLVDSQGQTFDGNPSTVSLDSNLSLGSTLYGGITASAGKIVLDPIKLQGLSDGRYKIVAFQTSAPTIKVSISFSVSAGASKLANATPKGSATALGGQLSMVINGELQVPVTMRFSAIKVFDLQGHEIAELSKGTERIRQPSFANSIVILHPMN